jgi:hypothetical protein
VRDGRELELRARPPVAVGDQLGLKLSTNDSASALSYALPTEPTEASTR